MAVRLREADSIAAVAELRQQIAELEIQVRRGGRGFIWRPEGEVECFPPSLSTLLT